MNARRLLSLVAAGALLAGCAGQPEMQTIVKSPEQIEAELRDIEACEKLREGKADDYLRPIDRCDNLPTHYGQPTVVRQPPVRFEKPCTDDLYADWEERCPWAKVKPSWWR